MKKIRKKKLLLLPIIAIFGILLCIINVKNDTFTTLTSSIRHFFEGNDEELIEAKAKESGFEDVNLYTSVIDSYNVSKEDINIIPPTEKVRGEMSYLGGFSSEVNVENDTVSFTDGEVKFYEADETVGRMSAANRVGLKITAPETLTYEEYKNAKIIRINTYEDKTQINEMIFDNVKDSETYYETWPVVTNTLKQVTILINWTGTDYQVFTMYFNNVTLENSEETTPSITQDKVRGEMSYLGGFSSEVNVENDTVSFTDGEVKFYEADETVGRMSAANRVGLKITAPETLTYEEYKNAKIIRINTYEDKTQINEMTFDNVKDSETYYETCPVVTNTLKQVTILINWTGNDYQVFTMNFNNVTLEKNPNAKISYKDGITSGQMTEITTLDASNKNISSSKGLEQLTNLESLNLSNNNLEYIDLTSNEKLTNINLSNNNFTKNIILYNDMPFDATKYSSIVKLPQSLKVEELSNKEEDNKHIISYGIPATEALPEQSLYEITYNVNYYEYITDKYILNSQNNTIYTINKGFYLDEENPDTMEQILDNGIILRNENNILNIYDNENNVIKSFTISKIESSIYDLNKSYIYENNINNIIENINYPDTLELSTYNNILTIKEINSDQVLINIPILNVRSTDYDITENYIFTGIEELNLEKIIKSNEEINLSIEENNLVISYNTEELNRLPIKNITSNTYDLTNRYINDTNFDLSLINYDQDLISTNISDDNILTFNYKENVYTYYLVNINIPYVTKEADNKKVLYTNFNENFDLEKIITTNASKEVENNILTIKYGDKEETYTIIEPKYEISASYKTGVDYIYTGTDKEVKEVTVSNGTKKVENNTLILTSDSGEEVTYSLYSISSNKYDLNKEYIYVGREDLDSKEITKNDELTINNENNTLEIMLNNEVVDSYKIISLSINSYKVDDKKIYIGFNNFDINNITATNAEKNIVDNTRLEIKYNNEILDTYEIKQAQLSSNKYNLKEEYIYTKFEKLDKSAIIVENALDYSIDLNGLNQLVINCDNSTKKYDIISLSIPKDSNISTKDTIIYTINNKVDDNNIIKNLISSNSKLKVEGNSIKVQYNNLYLDEIPFTQITIDEKYDLTKDYIYENNIENIKNAITPVETSNITNNTLSIKIYNIEVLNKKILSINSTDYDITENYIFTGIEELNLEKIVKSNNEMNLSIEDNNLVISYNKEELDRLPIKNITSNKYDLKNSYINDNKFALSQINYDKDLISANISKDNVLTFNYKDKSYNYYLVSIEIPYIIKDNKLYTKFNEQFNINNIKITNATSVLNKNILTIKYGNKTETYTVIEPKYEIPYDYDSSYIYTGTDTEASKIKVSNGTKKIEDGLLTLTSEVGEKVTYPLYSISSDKYNLNKDYIYVGRDNFKESDIKTSQNNMISISNNEIHINVNNNLKKSYKLIKLTINKYKVEDKTIYTGLDNLDITNIALTNNAKAELNNNKLSIKYNNEVLDTYTIITTKISSSKYDLSKAYIYTGTAKFDEKAIIIENGDKKIDTKKNTITISNNKLGILKTYNIVTINKIPDHSAGYIYTDTNTLNVNDKNIVDVTNATANIVDNNLVILKGNDELLRIPLISIISKIDLSKGYIYGLTDANILSNIKVSNGKAEIAETKDTKKLIIKDSSNKILKEVNIPKITFNKNVDVKGKVIMIKEKIDYKEFIKNVSCKSCKIEIKNNKDTISSGTIEHQMKLNVMYNSTILDTYTFSVDYLEMNSISYDDKYIYGFRHGSKVGDLISNISTSGKIKVTTPENKELTSSDNLATGEKVTITLNDGNVIEYTIVVKGDVLGHATVSVGDVGTLFLHLRKINNVEECYEKAGDVLNPGNGITIGDVSTIFLYIRGIINNLEE